MIDRNMSSAGIQVVMLEQVKRPHLTDGYSNCLGSLVWPLKLPTIPSEPHSSITGTTAKPPSAANMARRLHRTCANSNVELGDPGTCICFSSELRHSLLNMLPETRPNAHRINTDYYSGVAGADAEHRCPLSHARWDSRC